jgi:hypothetical protein
MSPSSTFAVGEGVIRSRGGDYWDRKSTTHLSFFGSLAVTENATAALAKARLPNPFGKRLIIDYREMELAVVDEDNWSGADCCQTTANRDVSGTGNQQAARIVHDASRFFGVDHSVGDAVNFDRDE